MKRFSTWLLSGKPKYSALANELGAKLDAAADAYYGKTVEQQGKQVALHLARGAARGQAKDLVMNLGNLLQQALVAYYAEVVRITYQRLDSDAAKLALSVEWDMLLHQPGTAKLSNLKSYIDSIDEFAKRFQIKKGITVLWDEFPYESPNHSDIGFIPEIGCGFSDSWDKKVHAPSLGEPGIVELENKSEIEFNLGSPGSAWIGLLAIAKRTGLPRSMIYLIPALHMEKHLSMPHVADGVSVPVEQWCASGHQEATFRVIQEGRLPTTGWHKTIYNPQGKLNDPKDATYCGCVMGFAMVKAYNAIGHQWAFTSATLNPPATDEWVPRAGDGLLVGQGKGDAFYIPTSWARAIWNATKDLKGNIFIHPGRRVVPGEKEPEIPQAPALPPPPAIKPAKTPTTSASGNAQDAKARALMAKAKQVL